MTLRRESRGNRLGHSGSLEKNMKSGCSSEISNCQLQHDKTGLRLDAAARQVLLFMGEILHHYVRPSRYCNS